MARGALRAEPVFRQEIDRCAELLRAAPRRGSARGCSSPAARTRQRGGRGDRAAATRPRASPSRPLFVVEYALARLWMSWGVQPAPSSATASASTWPPAWPGCLTLEDALRAGRPPRPPHRGAARRRHARGAARGGGGPCRWLGAELSLAAVNGPTVSVLAGPVDGRRRGRAALGGEGLPSRRLPTSHAFHSAMMEPVLARLAELLGRLQLSPPKIPYLSNVTGAWITDAEATDPAYWARHLCGHRALRQAVEELWREPGEPCSRSARGTGSRLSPCSTRRAGGASPCRPSPTPRDRQPDAAVRARRLGRLWLAGSPWIGQASTPASAAGACRCRPTPSSASGSGSTRPASGTRRRFRGAPPRTSPRVLLRRRRPLPAGGSCAPLRRTRRHDRGAARSPLAGACWGSSRSASTTTSSSWAVIRCSAPR